MDKKHQTYVKKKKNVAAVLLVEQHAQRMQLNLSMI